MFYNERRPFGKYTELLLIARQAYEQKNKVELSWDPTVKQLKPTIANTSVMGGTVRTIFLHPCDYIWLLLGHNITWAHQVSLEWQMWNIERMAQNALARIEKPTPIEAAEAARVYLEDFDINNNSYGFLREITPWDTVVAENVKFDPILMQSKFLGAPIYTPPGSMTEFIKD